LRILYVINSFDIGGAEHGLLTLVREGFFARQDLKVIGFCAGRQSLVEDMRKAVGAQNLILASETSSLTPQACLAGGVAITRLLGKWRPDVMVLSLKQANVVGRLVAQFFPTVRCVSFEHISRYRAQRMEWLYPFLLRALSRRVDEVWADCRQTLDETRHYFKPRKRSEHVVPLFRCDSNFSVKTDYALGRPIRIAGAGRLVKRKNFDLVIDAVAASRRQGIDITLDILGDGQERPALQASVAQNGMSGFVSLPGYRKDWHGEMRHYDFFVNLSETEGFCIVVAEAMSIGLPVIATDVGGIREYGVDGFNMVKLARPSADLLKEALLRLIGDEALRSGLGRRAHEDMARSYSAEALRIRAGEIFNQPRAKSA
jgi:glycosyltransferase involved in cell wall biosynthesis